MARPISSLNFSDTTPAPPSGHANVGWQSDANTPCNISAYVPVSRSLLNGSGAPTSALGSDGDFYLDTAASVLYGPKASGAWPTTGTALVGPTGPQGPAGATGPQGPTGATGATGAAGTNGTNGNTVLNGSGAPTSALGNNGDFYLDTGAEKLYGPKASGAWPSTGTALVGPAGPQGATGATGPQGPAGATGPQGPTGATGATGAAGTNGTNGNTVLNGSGAPSSSLGNNGDFYLDTGAEKLYGPKASGAWPTTGTALVGPAGPQGATGPQGPAGATGPQGAAGSPGPQGPTGATGATGAAGTNGTNGNTVLNGSGAPTSGLGNNGDFYLDTGAEKLYGPKAFGAWPSTGTALVGPAGPQGATGATGPQGPAGATGQGYTWRGTWAFSTSCNAYDTVAYQGSSYLALVATTGSNPSTDNGTHWALVASMGANGATGSQGPAGTAATISVGTTTTGAAGSNASVTNSGSSGAATFNFTIPQGATGATGSPGTNGNTIYNGMGTPLSSLGQNGDFYLNTATEVLYGPKAAGAWPTSGTSLLVTGPAVWGPASSGQPVWTWG